MIKEIFPVKIYETEFKDYHLIKQEIVDKVLPYFDDKSQVQHKLLNGGYSTANTIRDIHKKIDIKVLEDFINHHINEYWKSIGFSSRLKPYILHMWVNKIPKGGNLASHNHNPNVLAGAFYISASPDTGNLCLEHPMDALMGRMPWENTNFAPISMDQEIDVTDGKLILFPGWLSHKTKINQVDDNRIVVGMNIACAGPNLFYHELG